MNIKHAKSISIVNYLEKKGFPIKKEKGKNIWFLSPLRDEKTASFKVDILKNEWYDFGLGEGGTIFRLVELMLNTTDPSAVLHELESYGDLTSHNTFSFHKQYDSMNSKERIKIEKLSNDKLLHYVTDIRHVDIEVARNECKEIHLHLGEKYFYGVAFPNMSGGYEVRFAIGNYKRCVGKKDISLIKQASNSSMCCVFEGFMDYLSYLSYKSCSSHSDGIASHYDYMILNSTSMAQMAKVVLAYYDKVYLFLDNDSAGQTASKIIMSDVPNCINLSEKFLPYNDFNDWYCNWVCKRQESE